MSLATLVTVAKRGRAPKYPLVDKQNVVDTYNGIVFSFKGEENSDTCDNMEEV